MGAYEFDPAAGPDFDGDGDPDSTDGDDDGDGVADGPDCDEFNDAVSQVAAPIGPTLLLDKSGTDATLRWLRGVEGHVSNVYRGTIVPGGAW